MMWAQSAIRNIYRSYQNQNDFVIPEADQLKRAIEEKVLPGKHAKKAAREFMGYFKSRIDDSKQVKGSTIKPVKASIQIRLKLT